MTGPLVRGTTDRLRLDWQGDVGTAPDGSTYTLQSEHVRGEERTWWYELPDDRRDVADCPYGFVGTRAEARRTAEWYAWHVAGRPAPHWSR